MSAYLSMINGKVIGASDLPELVIGLLNENERLKKELQSKNLVPHKCPVCGGNGIVSGGFYNSVGGYGTSTNATEKCRACNGIGVIYT